MTVRAIDQDAANAHVAHLGEGDLDRAGEGGHGAIEALSSGLGNLAPPRFTPCFNLFGFDRTVRSIDARNLHIPLMTKAVHHLICRFERSFLRTIFFGVEGFDRRR